MTYISHIVANGCSFTWGAELENRSTQAWPAILAKKLGVPLVNIARCGTGNGAIHRRTHEYFYSDLNNDNNPFYVIGFSLFTRSETWTRDNKYYKQFQPFNSSIIKTLNLNPEQKEYLDNFDVEDLYRKTLLYKISLKNLFITHNIPHLFLDCMYADDREKEAENICMNKFPNLYNEIKNDANSMGKLSDFLVNPGYCKGGHYDANTNEQIGEIVFSQVCSRYNLDIVNNKFLTLTDFTNSIEPQYNSGKRI